MEVLINSFCNYVYNYSAPVLAGLSKIDVSCPHVPKRGGALSMWDMRNDCWVERGCFPFTSYVMKWALKLGFMKDMEDWGLPHA
jgi:hypothetical protein